MIRIFLAAIFLPCSLASPIKSQKTTPVQVTTSRGDVVGYHFDQGNDTTKLFYGQVDIFLGIPFAQPPLEELRFAKPQPLTKFTQNPWNATYNRLECAQPSYDSSIMGEDCLYLNILSPNVKSSTKYPVMVWIHGGGFLRGNGQPYIPGAVRNIVNRRVVLVLIQYRLGALGFFTTHTPDFPPNRGLLDQIEALKFIQQEISNFGGDPNKVTIFGESAGAASVNAHTLSPLSRGLFQQAIMESGTAHLCFEDNLGPTYQNLRFAGRACDYTYDMWTSGNFSGLKECLRDMDPQRIVGFQMAADGPVPNALCYNMVQDDNFFPGTPRDLAKNRPNYPTIIGTNKDEWGTFELIYIMNSPTKITNYTKEFAEFRLTQVFASYLGNQMSNTYQTLEKLYLPANINDTDHYDWLNFVVSIGTTYFWTGPVGRDISLNLQNGNKDVYVYEFTYYSGADAHTTVPGWKRKASFFDISLFLAVTHGAETSFLFMGWGPNDLENHQLNISDVYIADFFGESWTNFAKYGKPSTDDSWKPATSAINNTAYWEIGWNAGMRPAYRNLDQIQYNEILPNLIGTLPKNIPDLNKGPRIGCPNTFLLGQANPHHCYALFNTPKNWSDAESYCMKYFTGSKTGLKNIDSAIENSELTSYLKTSSFTPSCNNKVYIGLYKHGRAWRWDDGKELEGTYTNWDLGYPKNDSNALCAFINPSNGKWQNQDCDLAQCFICEQVFKPGVASPPPEVKVTTSRGEVIGYHVDQGDNTKELFYGQGDVFLGIPFAKPPVGPLRFSKPQKMDKFTEMPYDATFTRKECTQPNYREGTMSEDCLYLNILTPSANSSTKYPVMVWIHGGGFLRGSGTPSIPGTVRNFVSRGVVVVFIQYRLGFFTTHTDDFPPNLGLLDQIEALKFIQQEISNFGGDPNKVTIFGESAGSASVNAHTLSPLSRGLFQQAIMESGTAHLCFEDNLGPTYQNLRFAERACGYTYDQWISGDYKTLKDCLMGMDPSHLISNMMGAAGPIPNALCYNMVQDDYFFPGTPRNLAKNRPNYPTIIGTNKDEWGTFELIYIMNSPTKLENYTREFAEFRLKEVFSAFYGDQMENVLKKLEKLYFPQGVKDDDHMAWLDFVTKIGTTNFFTGPVGRDIQLNLQNGNQNVYVYEFTYYSGADAHTTVPGWQPVTHGAETSFVFMGWSPSDLATGAITQADVQIADFFGESWTNFAKYGKPSTDNSWKPAMNAINNTVYWEIGSNSGMRSAYRNVDQIQFNEVLPSLLGTLTPREKPDTNKGAKELCYVTYQQGQSNPDHCYAIFNTSMSQAQATGYCGKYYIGAKTTLKNVDNAFENAEFESYLKSSPIGKTCQKAYIGLYAKSGSWVWQDGSGSYRNWDAGYPLKDTNTNACVVINLSNGMWQNQPCSQPECFICESVFK